MTFLTPQSLWLTQLLCVINQLIATLDAISNDYCLTTYLSIITISVTLTIITLAIFLATSLPLDIVTFHSPKTHNLTISLSINQSFQQNYQVISWLANCRSTQNICVVLIHILLIVE